MILIKEPEKQANFYRKQQKVYEYAMEFWKEIVPYVDPAHFCVHDDILPLYCFWIMEEVIYAVEMGSNTKRNGGLEYFKQKQAVIRIGIDCKDDCLTDKLKRTIRHEIIHYLLWLVDMGHKDDDLDFWCYCYVFKARAYVRLSEENRNKYLLFKNVYDKKIKRMSAFVASNIISFILNKFKEEDNITESMIVQIIDEEIQGFNKAGVKC